MSYFDGINFLTDNFEVSSLQTLSIAQRKLILSIINTILYLLDLLQTPGLGINIIRKIFNIPLSVSKKNGNQDKEKEGRKKGDKSESDSKDIEEKTPSQDTGPISPSINDETLPIDGNTNRNINHNGARTSEDLKNIDRTIENYHPCLKHGDKCPEELCEGRVYYFLREGKHREIISFDFSPNILPTVNIMKDLRCNLCRKFFKAELPSDYAQEGLTEKSKYSFKAMSSIVLLHYGMGMPFYRFDFFQSLVGERIPESMQFQICELMANIFFKIYNYSLKVVANCKIIQGDDSKSRVLSLNEEIRRRRTDKKITIREGVNTSMNLSLALIPDKIYWNLSTEIFVKKIRLLRWTNL